MRYFKYLLFSLSLLIPALAHSQVADTTLTLQQCIDIAIKNNLDVKKSELALATAQVNSNQAKEFMLPTISGQVDHSINNGRGIDPSTNTYVKQSFKSGNYSLSGDLTVFSGLQNLNNIKQTSLAYQAGKMDLQQAKDQITINVITAYLLVLNNTELFNQVKNQLDVSKKQVERLEILEKEGANKLPSDLYDLKGTFGDNQLNVVTTNATLKTSKLNLLQILNIPYRENISLQPINADDLAKQTTNSADQVYDIALNQLAYIKAAILRRQSAEKGVSVAKGSLFPTVSLYSGISTNYSSAAQLNGQTIGYYDQFKNNYGTQFGVSLRMPILNYMQNRNKVALAKIQLQNNIYVEQTTKVQLKQNVEQAYLNMTSAYDKYNVLTDQVKAYTESFRTAEIRFNAGVLTSVDFVVAKNNLDRAKINLINARYEVYIYNKILDYYQGKLSL
ncbi:TolC family protein [Mucilaginibacter psychrotolerans]|uniref:TolC family protein n=1 Tax=Mucilaginibacter psychrotolerans TaxID=1524096 RepID=A0A4Y8SKK8_9SPHI|nr:TolC family protein [Mucilaginibacter psychrotolerans]TFF39215.1 TolC family protein [Mucilaginibacter psychrotolerans]